MFVTVRRFRPLSFVRKNSSLPYGGEYYRRLHLSHFCACTLCIGPGVFKYMTQFHPDSVMRMKKSTANVIKSPGMMPYSPEGTMEYGQHVSAWHDIVKSSTPLLLRAIDEIEFSTQYQKPFAIADFGSADGTTIKRSLCNIIDAVREKYSVDQEIIIYLEDQPCNDYNTMFSNIHGCNSGGNQGIQKRYDGVYILACGTSLYQQCFPSNYIDLALSYTTMHWLSKNPIPLKTSVFYLDEKCSQKERTHFANVAKDDWETILVYRAKELKPGGCMILSLPCINALGQYSGNTRNDNSSEISAMCAHWLNMAHDGIITQEEFENTNINIYLRRKEEFLAPFNDLNSRVVQAGLRLISMKSSLYPCAHQTAWQKSNLVPGMDSEKAEDFARKFVMTMRVWSNATFFNALKDNRTLEERKSIVNAFYQRYEQQVTSDPSRHIFEQIMMQMYIKKVI